MFISFLLFFYKIQNLPFFFLKKKKKKKKKRENQEHFSPLEF